MSIKSDLLKIKPKPVEITVPDWNDTKVHVVPLTGTQMQEFLDAEKKMDAGEVKGISVISGYVMEHMTDADGTRIFDDGDLEKLLDLPWDGTLSIYHCIASPNVRRIAMTDAAKGNSKKTSG